MGQDTITQREQERRDKQRAQQAAAGRAIFGAADSPVEIPGHGPVRLVFTNRSMAWAERHLTPLLDDLPDRLQGQWLTPAGDRAVPDHPNATFQRWDNCWDGLDAITRRHPMQAMPVLLIAGTKHVDGLTEDDCWDMPPSVLANEEFAEAVGQAVAAAFGQGVDDTDPPTDAPDEGTPAA